MDVFTAPQGEKSKLLGDITSQTGLDYVIHKEHKTESLTVKLLNSNLVYYAGELVKGTVEYHADSLPTVTLNLNEETEFHDEEDREYLAKTDFLGEKKRHIPLGEKHGNLIPFEFRLPVKVPFGSMVIRSHHGHILSEVRVDYHLDIAVKNKNLLTLGGILDPFHINLKIPLKIFPQPIKDVENIGKKAELVGSHSDFKVFIGSDILYYGEDIVIEVENHDKVWHKKDISLDLLTELDIESSEYEANLGRKRTGMYQSLIQTTRIGDFEATQGESTKYKFKLPVNAFPFFQDGTVRFKHILEFYNQSSRVKMVIQISSPIPSKDRDINFDDIEDHFFVYRTCTGDF
jgi:hypothetical protein